MQAHLGRLDLLEAIFSFFQCIAVPCGHGENSMTESGENAPSAIRQVHDGEYGQRTYSQRNIELKVPKSWPVN